MKALLIDDHALFRDGLALLLQQRFPEVDVEQVSDLSEALDRLAQEPPVDLVLLDLGLRDSDGVSSLARIHAVHSEVSVVVLSGDDRPETVEAALAAGANGFIPKTARGGVIDEALRVVIGGGVYLPRNALVAERLDETARQSPTVAEQPTSVRSHEDAPATTSALDLSARQFDVLRLMAGGLSSKYIARELNLAESTVKSHVLVIFRKLGVDSRAQAVLTAVRMGVVPSRLD